MQPDAADETEHSDPFSGRKEVPKDCYFWYTVIQSMDTGFREDAGPFLQIKDSLPEAEYSFASGIIKEDFTMAEERQGFVIMDNESGQIQVADEVVAIIAGLVATEVDGVTSIGGNITKDVISRMSMKSLSKGIRVDLADNKVVIYLILNIAYGYAIPEVTANVQNKVKSAIETMTGLSVSAVNIRIADVDMKAEA